MMLVGKPAMESEKRAHEERERGAAARRWQAIAFDTRIVHGRRVASPAVRARRSWRDWRARWLGCRVAIKVGGSCVCRKRWWAWQPYARVIGGPGGFQTENGTVD